MMVNKKRRSNIRTIRATTMVAPTISEVPVAQNKNLIQMRLGKKTGIPSQKLTV